MTTGTFWTVHAATSSPTPAVSMQKGTSPQGVFHSHNNFDQYQVWPWNWIVITSAIWKGDTWILQIPNCLASIKLPAESKFRPLWCTHLLDEDCWNVIVSDGVFDLQKNSSLNTLCHAKLKMSCQRHNLVADWGILIRKSHKLKNLRHRCLVLQAAMFLFVKLSWNVAGWMKNPNDKYSVLIGLIKDLVITKWSSYVPNP